MGTEADETVDRDVSLPSVRLAAEFVCPECGRECKGAQGLAGHRAKVHGVPGKNAARYQAKKKKKKGRGARRGPVVNPQGSRAAQVTEAIEFLGALLHEQDELIDACVAGLTKLTAEAKKLRHGYIARTAALRKLQAQIESLDEGK